MLRLAGLKENAVFFYLPLDRSGCFPHPSPRQGREDPREQLRKMRGSSLSEWSSPVRVDFHTLQPTVPGRASSGELGRHERWRKGGSGEVRVGSWFPVSSEHCSIGLKRAGHRLRRPQEQKAGRALAEVGSEWKEKMEWQNQTPKASAL